MDELPVFLMAHLMEATCDDRELAAQVVGVFLNDIPVQLESLDAALKSSDAKTAERVAHSIKGASATVGGERLRQVALECEAFGREKQLDKLGERVPELRAAYEELAQALRDEGFSGE
jgi:FOG: HPt domain